MAASVQSRVIKMSAVRQDRLVLPSPLSAISIPDQVQWPYMQQWNLGVEHELPGSVLLSVAYVGSKGTHLTREYDINQLQAVPAAQNPYIAANLPITSTDCQPNAANFTLNAQGLPTSATISNGAVLDQAAAQNLYVACAYGAANYFRPYQGWSTITRLENTANSIYNSLQIAARRSVGDLTFSASYTFSHSIDDSSDRGDALFVDPSDAARNRASSNFDVRHLFSISYVYAIPLFKQPGMLHTLLGGWQASGITTATTGLPFTVVNGTTYGDNAGVGSGVSAVGSYPDVQGSPNNPSTSGKTGSRGLRHLRRAPLQSGGVLSARWPHLRRQQPQYHAPSRPREF